MTAVAGPPAPAGLYDPLHEHDACGVGFVVHIKGRRSHAIVQQALQVLMNLRHRGACGCEANTGDGAGILLQVPDRFFRKVLPFALPAEGEYGVGLVFLPREPATGPPPSSCFERLIAEEGQHLLGWRDVPTDDREVGPSAVAVEPVIRQVFVGRDRGLTGADARVRFERKLYVIRKRFEHAVDALPAPSRDGRQLRRQPVLQHARSTRAC